jgi:hypothetical protein
LAVHAVTGDGWARADCAEAAAEIERLLAERDRLREALRELLRVGVRVAGGLNDRLFSADDEHPLFDTLDEWRTAADAARAALKETGHE